MFQDSILTNVMLFFSYVLLWKPLLHSNSLLCMLKAVANVLFESRRKNLAKTAIYSEKLCQNLSKKIGASFRFIWTKESKNI